MSIIDKTLQRIRAFNTRDLWLLNEANDAGFQSMDDFYKQMKDFYAQQGVVVSDKLIKFIVDVFGAEAAENPAMAQVGKNIFKNPTRFVTNVLQALNIDPQTLANKVNAKGNEANNPQVKAEVDKQIPLLVSIEKHVSGAHSTLDTISADLYKLTQTMPQYAEAINSLVQTLNKKKEEEKDGNPCESKYDTMDLTNREIGFVQGSAVFTGTVLVDSDSGILSQEYLDTLNKDPNNPLVKESLAEIQGTPHRVWVQSNQQVYVVEKCDVKSVDEANKVADFIQNAPDEIKSILQKETVFFSPITGEVKKDEKIRRGITKPAAASDYRKEKFDAITSKWGMAPTPSPDEEHEGEFYSPITPTNAQTPIVMVLRWMAEHGGDDINFRENDLTIANGKMSGGVFTSKSVTLRFKSETRSRDVGNVTSMDAKIPDQMGLRQFCKSKGILTKEVGDRQTVVVNQYINKS